jgi:hypothetical protein
MGFCAALLEPGAFVAPLWRNGFIEIVIPSEVESKNRGNTFSIKAYRANKNSMSFRKTVLRENFSQNQ